MEAELETTSFISIVKVLVLGNTAVGKTNLIKKLTGIDPQGTAEVTVGVDFYSACQNIDGQEIKFQFWDSAGQSKYCPLSQMLFRDSKAIILIYDITNYESFEAIDKYISDINRLYNNGDYKLIIIGNKLDLKDTRAITYAEGEQKANQCNASFYEISALKGINVDSFFDSFSKEIYNKFKSEIAFDPSGTIELKSESEKELHTSKRKNNAPKSCCEC